MIWDCYCLKGTLNIYNRPFGWYIVSDPSHLRSWVTCAVMSPKWQTSHEQLGLFNKNGSINEEQKPQIREKHVKCTCHLCVRTAVMDPKLPASSSVTLYDAESVDRVQFLTDSFIFGCSLFWVATAETHGYFGTVFTPDSWRNQDLNLDSLFYSL